MTVHRASDRASDRPSAPQAYQCKMTQSTGMGTQMLPLKNSRFYLEGNHMAARTFRQKKVVSFSVLFFMCTLTWITEKELERVIKNSKEEKHDNSKRR